ncbi:MAG: glycosyltransferase family 4 protein, partial [Muribaculaceae bacterium]
EEAVVDKMADMLVAHGHEVVQYRKTTADTRESFIGKVKGFVAGCYSPSGIYGLREVLQREKPDVVNVHNLYPFISPVALFECKKAKVPVVMTVHNFRLMCPTGLFLRNGKPCEECLKLGSEWGCIQHNCEHSILKSLGYAMRNRVARRIGAYHKCVDSFACITDFQRKKLIEAGFDTDKITVIPNSVEVLSGNTDIESEGCYVGFCGRLSREKGVDMIVEVARRHPEIPFKLAGKLRVGEDIGLLPPNCELTGYLQADLLAAFYRNARFFVMASRWYEGFPMSILEAAQYGKCMVAPDHGGFTEIIGKGSYSIGCVFMPNDVDSLEQAVVVMWNNPQKTKELGQRANEKLQREYSSDIVYSKWNKLLNKVVKNNSNG